MDTKLRTPSKGDRIQIKDFIGVFEVLEVRENGAHCDLRHLSMPIWNHTATDMLSREITYLTLPQQADGATPAIEAAAKPTRWAAMVWKIARRDASVSHTHNLGKAYS